MIAALTSWGVPADRTLSVVVVSSFQKSLGCHLDWDPVCVLSGLERVDHFPAGQVVRPGSSPRLSTWRRAFVLPQGEWEFKVALNSSWAENFGLGAQLNSKPLKLSLARETAVRFYYSRRTNWATSDRNALIVTAMGNFQTQLGCAENWQPACLESWLQDPDGDGIYVFETTDLSPGTYRVAPALDESWALPDQSGDRPAPLAFIVPPGGGTVKFSFSGQTRVLSAQVSALEGHK